MGCCKSSSNTEVYRNTILPQETRKINNLTLQLKQLEKEQTKPKVNRRKKIKEKIKKKQMKERQRKQWKRSMKVKAGSLKKDKQN